MIGALIDRPISNGRASVSFDEITEVVELASFFSASEEVLGVEHLFSEPGCYSDMFDSILGFNVVNPQKCFDLKDFACDMEYDGVKLDGGAHDSILAQGDETKLEFVDGLVQVTDEGVLHATNSLPDLCEDHFLVTDLSDEGSTGNDGLSEEYCLKHMGQESQCPSSHIIDSVAISESSDATMPMHESTLRQNCFLGLGIIDCDSVETLSDEIKSDIQGLQDFEAKVVPLIITNRRLRKPNLRYVEEESMEQQPKRQKNICELSNKSWDNFMHLKPHKKSCREGNGGTQLICEDESFREAIQVPFSIPIHKRQSKKRTSFQKHESEEFKDCRHSVSDENNYMEPFLDESQDEMSEDDDCTTMYRKKNKYWTTSETMKLTEGVSQYGVGKWSKIKSHLFLSASHRTPIDLKDKWRNLMRAAGRQVRRNTKVKPKKKHPPRQMLSILRRVKELAALPSHPKQCKLEGLVTAPIAPHTPAPTCEKSLRRSTLVKG